MTNLLIQENVSLKPYNTFGVNATARFFARAKSTGEAMDVFDFASALKLPFFILGGGSNVLFTRDFDGIIIQPQMQGIRIADEDSETALVCALAGNEWEELIDFALFHDLSGIENLSMIPGRVGSSPIQNIGAYGVELKDVFHSLSALNIRNGQIETFDAEKCSFGYRYSIFKSEAKNTHLITSVTLRLQKRFTPILGYKDLREYFSQAAVSPGLARVRDAVREIRARKLPDVKAVGSAGSFFKNPVVSVEKYNQLLNEGFEISGYQTSEGVKLPAARLIEICGWKAFREQDAGVWPNQPLALVNYGQATGAEIYRLSQQIRQSVGETFDVALETEVNIL
jgi:UDP-N-acetylmuramate dehydrogenase